MGKNVSDNHDPAKNVSSKVEKISLLIFLLVSIVLGYFVHILFYFLTILIPFIIMRPDDDDRLLKLWDKEHRFKGLHGGIHG